jgi:hypothetical protein
LVVKGTSSVPFHAGAVSDGQRNAVSRVCVTVPFMTAPVTEFSAATAKFAALKSGCCSRNGNSRTWMLKSPLMICAALSGFQVTKVPGKLSLALM